MAGGRIIKGKYQIIREIGRGAMGIVYEVRHEELGSTLALKQLQLNLEGNPDIARRFRHEARMMARLQHSNIVRVWDIDAETEFGTFLVMEFINGPDLGKILRSRRLTYKEVLRIGGAVASALHTAHREGLVHRDVKPANILIEEHSMRAVVTDFGIAKQMKGDNEDSTVGTVGFLGTYRYSSPEQIRSERGVNIDGRADIYSLGVVLYEMYSGKKFLDGLSEGQITHLVGFHADWRPTLEYGEPPPEDFRLLVERCLVRNRDERIADAGEVADCLDICLRRADDAQRRDEPPAPVATHAPQPARAAEPETAITHTPPAPAAPLPDPHVIEEIEALQSTLAAEVAQLGELHQERSTLGAPPDGNGAITTDFGQRLDEIEGLKGAADFASARTALDDLRQEIAAQRDQELAALREALQSRLTDLRDRWRTLAEESGEFVLPERTRAVESLLDSIRGALEDDDRQAALRATVDGQRLLDEVQAGAREHCAAAVQDILARSRAQLRELGDHSAAAAIDLDAVEEESQAALRAGHLRDARTRAEAAASAVAMATRAAIEQQALRQQAEQRDALAAELRELLARAAEAPADIVGEARQQVQALLDAPPPGAANAVSAMAAARARLTAGLDEAAAFAAADVARVDAEAAHQRVAALEPSWRQRRRATAAMDKSAAAFKRRQWAAARDGYAQAVPVLAALEVELATERVSQQADTAKQQVDEVRSTISIDAAVAAAPEEYARANALYTEATQAVQQGEGATAIAAYESAAAAYRATAQRIREQQAAQHTAAQEALRELIDRAASAPEALIGDERQRATAVLDAAPPDNLESGLADIDRVQRNLAVALDALPVFTAAAERRDTAEARHTRVHALGLPRRRLAETDRLMKAAAAALEHRQWDVAGDTYGQADAAMAALEDAETQRLTAASQPAAQAQPAVIVPDAPRAEVATVPRYRWVGGAAIAAGVVSVAAWLLYPSTPDRLVVQESRPQPTAAVRPTSPVESKPPAPPPAPVLPHIATASPASSSVTLREGTPQRFSVALAGTAPGDTPPTQWKLDDRVVASNVAQWEYKPGFQDGGDSPRTLTVAIANGQGPDQSHTWQVKVDDVNRGPVVREASYKPGSRITAKIGDTLDFRVQAADEDSDPLRYAWTVDGKPAASNGPELKLPVTAENQRVALVVSDGKDSVPAEWSIAALAPPFKIEASPPRLDKLRFNEPQEFAIAVPPGVRAAGLQYAWSLDGQKVSDAPKFVLRDYKPSMVRDSPVVISATVRDDQQRSASYDWKARVIPPPPEIKSAAPPAERAVDAEPSRPQTFAVEANAPVGGQRFTYAYEVDGRPAAPDSDGRLTVTPSDDGPHQIVASVKDNYGQTSRQRVQWKLQAAATIVKRVQDWLQQYESAWNSKDAATIGRLRGLSADEVKKLEDSFKDKRDLRVTFTGLKTEKLDAGSAKASYTRRDEWVGRDGEPVARSRAVQQTFRLAGNQLQEAGETQ